MNQDHIKSIMEAYGVNEDQARIILADLHQLLGIIYRIHQNKKK